MTTTRITQIFNNASPLQAAGRTHCEYMFYITRPAFALCAEAALTPQYTLTHNTLGNIVSRIYILIMHKCPEMFSVVDNPAAFAGQFTFAERSFFKKFFYTLHQRRHPVLKSTPLQCPVANPLSQFQYFLRQTVKLLTYLANHTFGLLYRCAR
ncbi:hypothetical protein ES705_25277 [subsurface metagenome]